MIMNLDRSKTTTIAYLVLIIFFISCEDNQYPEDIWDPDDQGLPTPVITSIDPSSILITSVEYFFGSSVGSLSLCGM